MGLGKQAKTLSKQQIETIFHYVGSGRNGLRNQVILLLSIRAGLRAKEIAHLRWSMVVGSDGEVGDYIHLTNNASKGKSGRIIPVNKTLKQVLVALYEQDNDNPRYFEDTDHVIQTERSTHISPQAVVNMFHKWYKKLGLIGCSSHSGRRTFITNAA